ncbi:glycosyltransferase [Lysobacter sp. TY2-98]|uniref:glycosyltransferase family 2 protein n=1 Tax=Lysobacter sp. TY2-98 TaxID=2290922 RepID=UPI0013B3D48E|nr:glycosyltransferase [Lysobacter sp. TY2-98]
MDMISVVIPVYRDGARGVSAAQAILDQVVPAGCELEVVLVDDGSDDDTAELLKRCADERVRLLSLPRNAGRSAARNAGAAAVRSSIIVFMDCDCVPVDRHMIEAHYAVLTAGAVASTGEVTGRDSGFWSRYQTMASARRARQHAQGVTHAGSSQNLAVLRDAFQRVGGFDTGYRRYGFEDRDLLLRLATWGRVEWAGRARVRHLDELTLVGVSAKMREAGGPSAAEFARRFPEAYITLGYAAIDSRRHPSLRLIARIAEPRLSWLAASVDHMLRIPMPFAFKAAAVRLVSALSFCVGTATSES